MDVMAAFIQILRWSGDGFIFLCEAFAVPSDWTNRDMWDALLQRLQRCESQVSVRKVRAHLSLSDDNQEAWITYWNSVADVNAKSARSSCLPAQLQTIYDKLMATHNWQAHWARRCQQFLLTMATASIRDSTQHSRNHVDEPEDELVCQLTVAGFNHRDLTDAFPLDIFGSIQHSPALRAFGAETAVAFANWLLTLDQAANHVRPVTFFEILVGFTLEVGVELPVARMDARSNRTWLPISNITSSLVLNRTLGSKLEVVGWLLAELFRHFGVHLELATMNRPSVGLLRDLNGCVLPWPTALEHRVLGQIAGYTRSCPVRFARDLAKAWP